MRGMRFRLVIAAVLFGISACSASSTPADEPTQVLVPPTVTKTSVPITAVPTDTPLPRAGDIGSPTPTEGSPTPTAESTGVSLESDQVAADLAALAQRRVAQELNLPVRRVEIVEVEVYIWPDTSLGCPLAGQTYTPATVDGYRIVLSAGDRKYIFHTDFDRVIPCEAANEKLPETQ